MTPAERLADRIAKNRVIDAKVAKIEHRREVAQRVASNMLCNALETFLKNAPKLSDEELAQGLGAAADVAKKINNL